METVRGVVEDLVYSNEENGYSVVRLKSGEETITAVGSMVSPVPGELLRLEGEWKNHPRFGRQFSVSVYEAAPPATADGIERYLSSGLVPGIGPGLAGRIIAAFGEDTLRILEESPKRLSEVEGIGKKRAAALAAAWKEQREIRNVIIFLRSYGIGPALAVKIFQRYGNRTVALIRENPYRLCTDMFGVGFTTADKVARALGLAADSPARLTAGVLYVLGECTGEGHVFYPRLRLLQRCQKLLGTDREGIARAVEGLSAEGSIRRDGEAVYLPANHRAEKGTAELLSRLLTRPASRRPIDPEKALAWVQERMSVTLGKKQREALITALTGKAAVITGGPGTGKTTIIRALLLILERARLRFLQAAPTGRAAKRMMEAGGREAKTIHRLLEYSPKDGGFLRNEDNPLHCDWLILDETSMIDILLMHRLLRALPPSASLLLVGDADQLPSVGPGQVLRDIIDSGRVPVTELNEIYRQEEASTIVVNAHRINSGLLPVENDAGDFFFIPRGDAEAAARLIVTLCRERIPASFGLDPVKDIQVLSPMHRGAAGVTQLNRMLQDAMNPRPVELVRGERRYRPGDKVMQVRNNYDKDVFNGDMGRIIRIDTEARAAAVRFEDQTVDYDYNELDEIVPAYAISVHKSQGAEFPAVIVPVLTDHYLLLQRNLLYTAVSRGKKLVVLAGTKKALSIACKNTDSRERYTGLKDRLTCAVSM